MHKFIVLNAFIIGIHFEFVSYNLLVINQFELRTNMEKINLKFRSKIKSKINRSYLSNLKREFEIDKFVNVDSDFDKNILNICYLIAKYGVMIHKNIFEYQERKMRLTRLIYVIILRIVLVLNTFKYLLLAYFNNESMVILFGDSVYVTSIRKDIQDPIVRLSWIMFFITSLAGLVCSLSSHYLEIYYKNYIFDIGLDFINKKLELLNYTHTRKVNIVISINNLMARHLVMPLSLITGFVYLITIYLALKDGRYAMNKLTMLFWFIIFVIGEIQIFAILMFGIACLLFIILYIEYRFKELAYKIQCCSTCNSSRTYLDLMLLIIKHGHLIKLTEKMNKLFSVMLFVIYYMGSTTMLIMLYIGLSSSVILVIRIGAVFASFGTIIQLLVINLMSSRISFWAKEPIKALMRYNCQNRLTARQRLKIMVLIERLSGPDIGFYCLDLFPMNSYEFYLYVANCFKTFFLLLGI